MRLSVLFSLLLIFAATNIYLTKEYYLIRLKFQINRLQHIQNALAPTVVQAPKFQHITPILTSLLWLRVSERIEYKIISLTYKILNTTQPSYLYDLISTAYSRSQHTLFTLCHSDRTIIITQSHSPLLPTCFISSLEPASYITQDSSSKLFIPLSATIIWTCRFNLLSPSITFSLFHSELKTYLFRKSYPPS